MSFLTNKEFSFSTEKKFVHSYSEDSWKHVVTLIIGKENEEREDKSKRNYLDGIKDNLQLIKEKYGSDWIVRVYYHVKNYDSNTSPVMKQLCDLACSEPNLDLCDAQKNPRKELISCFNELWIYQCTNLFHEIFFNFSYRDDEKCLLLQINLGCWAIERANQRADQNNC